MKARLFTALRWIVLLPLSALGGWAAYAILNVSWQQIVPSFGFLSSMRYPIRAIIEFFANGFMGAAFAWTAFFIAPSQKKFASYISSGIAGSLALVSSGIGLAHGNSRPLLMTLPIIVGLTWVCRAIAKGDISLEPEIE
jgi:hypothetical protein